MSHFFLIRSGSGKSKKHWKTTMRFGHGCLFVPFMLQILDRKQNKTNSTKCPPLFLLVIIFWSSALLYCFSNLNDDHLRTHKTIYFNCSWILFEYALLQTRTRKESFVENERWIQKQRSFNRSWKLTQKLRQFQHGAHNCFIRARESLEIQCYAYR